MPDRHNHHDTPVEAQVAALRGEIALLRGEISSFKFTFNTGMSRLMTTLQDIQNKVANVTGGMNSMITFQKLLAQELKDALAENDTATMTAIANELDNDASTMAAAVLTNPDPGAPAQNPPPGPDPVVPSSDPNVPPNPGPNPNNMTTTGTPSGGLPGTSVSGAAGDFTGPTTTGGSAFHDPSPPTVGGAGSTLMGGPGSTLMGGPADFPPSLDPAPPAREA